VASHCPAVVPALLGLAFLAGCAGSPPPAPEAQVPPPPPAPAATAPAVPAPTAAQPGPGGTPPASSAPERGKPAAPATGLVPLPSPRQVIAALPVGRRDPFESPFPPLPPLPTGAQAAGGTAPAGTLRGRTLPPPPLSLPPGFRVTGLINSGGTSEAVVEYGTLSGSLRRGDRGGRTTDLLPGGWSVAAVDVNRGRVTLQRGQQRVTAEL